MDMYDLIMARRSVRSFQDRPVPQKVVDELLDAAVSAPSGGNIQPLSIVVIRDPARRERHAGIVGEQPWVKNAPLSLVFCLDFHRCKRWAAGSGVEFRGEEALNFFLIAYADVMCAAQNVTLMAEARGLGSVYIGTILTATREAREMLETPPGVLPTMLLSLGYPKAVPSGIPKLPRHSMVHDERYHVPTDEEVMDWYESKYGEIGSNIDKYLETRYVEAVEADRQDGVGWVKRVKEEMGKLEIKRSAEFLFKVRYPTDQMVQMNAEMERAYREAGFGCFHGSDS